MPDFIAEPAFEIGRRLEMRGLDSGAWSVVLKPAQDPDGALEDFAMDLAAKFDVPVRQVCAAGRPVGQLRADLHAPDDDTVLVAGLDQCDLDHWRALDINRSGLARRGPIVLWLSAEGLTGLGRWAPNLKSFVGGSIFVAASHGGVMTAEERQQRLEQLTAHYRMSGEEVIRRAESGALPTEPQFVEWLVLLGRGDLV
ncbi:MAG: hypothetical protein NT090_18310 [Acidobacteria bacterium]|nr:hypothetical protein [Acidobacteriota bacterium]